MPLIDQQRFREEEGLGQKAVAPEETLQEFMPVPKETPDVIEGLRASFETSNTLGVGYNFLATGGLEIGSTPPEKDYDPFAEIKGTKYEPYFKRFIRSGNPTDTTLIKNRINKEIENEEIIRDSRSMGYVYALGAGLLDPVNLVPFGAVTKYIKGASILRGAVTGGAVGLLAGSILEGTKLATEETSTKEGALVGVATATLFGGVLGTAGAGLLKTTEGKNLIKKGDLDFLDVEEHALDFRGMPRKIGKEGTPLNEDLEYRGMPLDRTEGSSLSSAFVEPEIPYGTKDALKFAKGTNVVSEKIIKGITSVDSNPQVRLANSPSIEIRDIAVKTMRTGGVIYEGTAGEAGKALPQSAEAIKNLTMTDFHLAKHEYENVFASFKQSDKAKSLGLNEDDFRSEIARHMNNNPSIRPEMADDPHVRQASKHLRQVVETLRQRAEENQLLGKGKTEETKNEYLPIQFDKDTVVANEADFKDKILKILERTSRPKDIIRKAELEKEIDELQLKQDKKIERRTKSLLKKKEEIRENIRVELAKKRIQEREEAEVKASGKPKRKRKQTKKLELEKEQELEAEVEKIRQEDKLKAEEFKEKETPEAKKEREITERKERYEDDLEFYEKNKKRIDEYDDITKALEDPDSMSYRLETAVNSVYDHITSSKIQMPAIGRVGVVGALKNRTLDFNPMELEEYLVRDPIYLIDRYSQKMGSVIALKENLGDKIKYDIDNGVTLSEQAIKTIDEHYQLEKEGKSSSEILKLEKQKKRDINDLNSVFEILTGTQGKYNSDPSGIWARAVEQSRILTYLTFLGGMLVSAIPDIARFINVHGFRKTFREIGRFRFGEAPTDLAREQLRKTGAFLELYKAKDVFDFSDVGFTHGTTAFERHSNNTAKKFSKASGMALWNDFASKHASIMTSDNIVGLAKKYASGGKISKKEWNVINNVYKLTPADLKNMAVQLEAHGEQAGTIELPFFEKWGDEKLADKFRIAVTNEVQRTVITKDAGNVPLWFNTTTGSIFSQFRSFNFAMTTKAIIPALQGVDTNAVGGIMTASMLGALTIVIKDLVAGRDFTEEFEDWDKLMIKGFSQSGWLGMLSEVDGLLDAFNLPSTGGYAYGRTSYGDKNILGHFTPLGDVAENLQKIFASLKTGKFTKRQLHAVRKLIPMQNLFYLRRILDKLEEEAID